MQVQQKAIAERAGVSYATVSRALNGTAKVNPETMQKIRNAMHELGILNYDDIFMGRNTLSKHVLVTVGDISNSFFSSIFKALHDKLVPAGYSLVLCNSSYDSDMESSCMRKAAESGYAGIIMITAIETPELLSFIRASKIPVVMVNRRIRAMDLDVVRIDNYREGYIAAEHLCVNGHRRIALLSGPKNSITAEDCTRGFVDALREYGVLFSREDHVYGDLTPKSGEIFARWLCEKKFKYTGVFIANDYMAASTVHHLLKMGIRVPEDISIVCIDDSPLVNEDSLNITAICTNPDLLGASAADVFLRRRENLLGERSQIIYSPQLKNRNSVKKLM